MLDVRQQLFHVGMDLCEIFRDDLPHACGIDAMIAWATGGARVSGYSLDGVLTDAKSTQIEPTASSV